MAQPGLLLTDAALSVDAWPAVTLLHDESRALQWADVVAQADRFRTPDVPASNLGVQRDAVWLRIPVQTKDSNGRWIIDIDYPSLQGVDVYLLRKGSLLQSWRLGASQPFADRPLPTRTHAALLELAPGTAYELLLRVQTDTSMVLPISFVKERVFLVREENQFLLQGALAGVALALLIYSLAHWVSLGNALFGLYAVMISGSVLYFMSYFGLLQQLLDTGQVSLVAKLAPQAVLLTLSGAGRFNSLAMDTATRHPRLHRVLNGLSVLSAVLLVASLLGLLDYRATQLAPTILGPLMLVASVPTFWTSARRGGRVGVYMLCGWSAYLAGAVVMAALLRGWVPANPWTQHAFQAGWLVEMAAWLRVLGLHMAMVRKTAERAEHERRAMESLAYTDAVTGLPNRRGMERALDSLLSTAANGGDPFAVLMVDLDGFKAVNDRLGHEAGDELLAAVGQRLRKNLRLSDVVARIGGDEFVVLAPGVATDEHALGLGRKLVAALQEPLQAKGQPCRVGLTVGVAVMPQDGREAGELLRRADAALYAGKQAGRGTVRRFIATMSIDAPQPTAA